MQFLVLVSIALLLGAITPVYLSMNSSVARYVGSPTLANISFFLVALIMAITIVIFISLISPDGEAREIATIAEKFKSVPPQYYLSGAFSALLVLGTTALIPRLGATVFFVAFVSGQVLMAVIVSHFGILESPQDPISLQKVVGLVFVIMGIAFTTVFKDISWFSADFRNSFSFWRT